jgi:predicted lysophospholipase L1 biosynthesis ABC-type transport system permease subunit
MLCLADSWMTVFSDKAIMFWMIGGTVAIVAILAGTVTSILATRAREQTRREIAAYLAEGSIDRDTALAMLKEGGEEEAEES